jgi:hypothetical protein
MMFKVVSGGGCVAIMDRMNLIMYVLGDNDEYGYQFGEFI